MAILKIARMGHPVLARPAVAVDDPTRPEIQRLLEDMVETMIDATGAGLAAPQVHVAKRIVVYYAPQDPEQKPPSQEPGTEETGRSSGKGQLTMLINPEITPLDPEMDSDWEGCLSVPGLRGWVPRYRRIRYAGLDQQGRPFTRMAEGFHARVVQHECDHLDGILYPQRMTDLSKLIFTSEWKYQTRLAGSQQQESNHDT